MQPIRIRLQSKIKNDKVIGHLFLRMDGEQWKLSRWLPTKTETIVSTGTDPVEASRLVVEELFQLAQSRHQMFQTLRLELGPGFIHASGFRPGLNLRLLTQATNRYKEFQRGVTTEISRLFSVGWPLVPVPPMPWESKDQTCPVPPPSCPQVTTT